MADKDPGDDGDAWTRRPTIVNDCVRRAMIAGIDEGLDEFVDVAPRKAPPAVLLAWAFGFVKALFLGITGIIGVAAWDDVTDPWGIGALVLGALFGLASLGLLRGSRAARILLAALAVVGGVMALVYVFVGPTSAIFLALVTAALDAVVLWLLYGSRGARDYFGT